MYQLFHLYFDICLLRKGPQAVPESPFLLLVTLLFNLTISLIAGTITDTFSNALAQALLGFGIMIAFTAIVLSIRGHIKRLSQTITAMLGTEALITIVLIPMSMVIIGMDTESVSRFLKDALTILWLMVVVWYLLVMAHILRHALSMNLFQGVLLSIGMLAITWQINASLFGS